MGVAYAYNLVADDKYLEYLFDLEGYKKSIIVLLACFSNFHFGLEIFFGII